MEEALDFSKWIKDWKLSPAQYLAIGFAAVILVGSILLNMKFVTRDNVNIGYINALFTATSAVCVTGLAVVDTGSYFNEIGQIIILCLIQIGGLGFMTMASLIVMLIGKKISLKSRIIMQESLNSFGLSGVVRLTKRIVLMTFIIESIGAVLLSSQFIPIYGRARGIYYGVFHSVSAFCNAGFDVLGTGDSVKAYGSNMVINFTLMGLIILGGAGFVVIMDVFSKRKFKRLLLHTKIVLITSVVLIAIGFVTFALIEWNNPGTIGNMSVTDKLLNSIFAAVTPRTAGFSTIDYSAAKHSTVFFTMVLMFIGGSSGSCAGGIKTTTLAVVVLTISSLVQGKEDTEAYGRSLSKNTVSRALSVFVIGLSIAIGMIALLLITEEGQPFSKIMFETFSAYGTVGLSMGFTSMLSTMGKILILLTMFMGRLGGLTIVFAVAQRQKKEVVNIKYPVDRVMIG